MNMDGVIQINHPPHPSFVRIKKPVHVGLMKWVEVFLVKEAAKKGIFQVARPLWGGGGKDLATKKKRTSFEVKKKIPKKIPPPKKKKCGH